jgi:catechol 2,3-dioxygenase-like lactoylglutathione lyase family enzyme
MAIRRFDHVAINSRDIVLSKKFYSEILGLKTGKSVNLGKAVLHYMQLPDGSAVELFEILDRKIYDDLTEKEGFFKHIAFNVDDIECLNRKLMENGIKFKKPLGVLEPLGVKTLLCIDPDGIIVELSQKIQGEK